MTTSSTGRVPPAATAASAEGQMEEGAHGTPIGEAAWPGVATTPQAEAAVLEADKLEPGATAMSQVETTQMGLSPVRTKMVAPVTDAVQPNMTAHYRRGRDSHGRTRLRHPQ
jgi:hypothetical protein